MTSDKLIKSAHVERRCMRDQIRETIVSRIMEGTYSAGDRLIELSLAREFNVSQAPIREALRELEALGMVESVRYRGTRVSASNSANLRESYEMRALLEERSAQMASPFPEEVLAQLEECLSIMHKKARAGSVAAYTREAMRFHRIIVEASGNRIFLHTWDMLQFDVRAHVVGLRVQGYLHEYAAAHEPILLALKDGNGVEAGRLLRELINRLMAALDEATPNP